MTRFGQHEAMIEGHNAGAERLPSLLLYLESHYQSTGGTLGH